MLAATTWSCTNRTTCRGGSGPTGARGHRIYRQARWASRWVIGNKDVLVIETTNLTTGTLDGSLLPMSGEGTRIVERWAFGEDRLTMDRTMTIYDPYYSKSLVRQRGSARRDSLVVFEPAPCDPDGYFRDLLETGRLEQHLSQ